MENIRKEIAELKDRYVSFADLVKESHSVILRQLQELNNIYLQFRDLQDDDYSHFGSNEKERRGSDARMLFDRIFAIFAEVGNEEMSIDKWVNGNYVAILDAMAGSINSTRNDIYNSGNNDYELTELGVMARISTSIDRMLQGMYAATNDGYDMLYTIYNGFINPYLVESKEESIDYLKNDYHYASIKRYTTIAKDYFVKILLDVKQEDVIDADITKANNEYDANMESLKAEMEKLGKTGDELGSLLMEAMRYEKLIAMNNDVISKINLEIDSITAKNAELVEASATISANIEALDPNSETYADDFAALQAQLAKNETEQAQNAQQIADLSQEIAARTANNAEFSVEVDKIPSYETEIETIGQDRSRTQKLIIVTQQDHYSFLSLMERKIQELIIPSSPDQKGGQVYTAYVNAISNIDNHIKDNYIGIGLDSHFPETSVDVEGMPQFRNSICLDGAFSVAFEEVGGSYELSQTFEEFSKSISENKKAYDEWMTYDRIYSPSSLKYSYEVEVQIEGLDSRKADADVQYVEVTDSILSENESISTLMLSLDELVQQVKSKNELLSSTQESLSSLQATIEQANATITKSQSTIEQALVSKSDAEANLAQAQVDKSTAEDTLATAQTTKSWAEETKAVQEQAKADYLANDGTDQTIIDSFDLTISNLVQTIAESEATIASANNAKMVAEESIANAQATITNAQSNIEQAQSEMATAESDKTIAVEEVAGANQLISALNEDLSSLRRSISELESNYANMKAKLSSLEKTKAELEDFINSYNVISASLLETKDNLVAQYQKEMNEIKESIKKSYDFKNKTFDDLMANSHQVVVVKSKSNIRNNKSASDKEADPRAAEEKQAQGNS
jgi:chromosome segregation ATPase